MHIDEADDGQIKAQIEVRNTAPPSSSGSEVVFMGVGLFIIDGREQPNRQWASKVKMSRSSGQQKDRQRYTQGYWIANHGDKRFPDFTHDEQSHGEVLFPGESLVYEIVLSEDELPYLEIKVEGTLSRRHIFHISQPMVDLRKWTLPPIAKTFKAVSKLDYAAPMRLVREKMPEFGPNTTLADIDSFRILLDKAVIQIGEKKKGLNEIYHSASNQELRGFLSQYIGEYIATTMRLFSLVLQAINSGDTVKMQQAAVEINEYQATEDELERQLVEMASQFGLNYK